ncbi:unnamed protein product [Acanthoscelides obtectus]|uniref:Uncharacterized protein n=1 Tax=Acanthoscelides obtectus TaxID=200917 RepID=A0A9P0L827_ACAOB|nr:unnamed protein product [Acanthoscelides obtectus]CAK1646019.1 hypothetical protein AOBTE_LOCUS14400 [Acanthoscelides obtectus]
MQHHRLYLKIVCTPRPRSTRRKGSLATPVDQLICFTYERHVPEFDLNRLLLWNLRGCAKKNSSEFYRERHFTGCKADLQFMTLK